MCMYHKNLSLIKKLNFVTFFKSKDKPKLAHNIPQNQKSEKISFKALMKKLHPEDEFGDV